MEHDLVVEGRLVLPGSVQEAQVGISGGRIAEVKRQGVKGVRTIRAGDALVFPGFIDSHVHLREPGWEQKEDFRSGTRAAVHGGVTTVLDMPNNPVPTTTPGALARKRELAASKAVIDVGFFAGVVGGNLGKLRKLEGVGYKAYLGRSTGELTLSYEELARALPEIAAAGRPLSLHCEDQAVLDERAAESEPNAAPDSYADVRPPEAEVAAVRTAGELVARTDGARANICHISTERALQVVGGYASAGAPLRCEVALHHLFFTRKAMMTNPLLLMNPPLRGEDDRRAVLEGLRDGKVNALVTDHAPHLRQEKAEGLAGVPGLDDYGHLVSWLIRAHGFDPLLLALVCASNPASFFGMHDRGEISVGKKGDLTVLDVKSPERVRAEDLMTKCGWSPYEGIEFPGRVKVTVKGGRVLMDESGML